jgi:hypothetical protein
MTASSPSHFPFLRPIEVDTRGRAELVFFFPCKGMSELTQSLPDREQTALVLEEAPVPRPECAANRLPAEVLAIVLEYLVSHQTSQDCSLLRLRLVSRLWDNAFVPLLETIVSDGISTSKKTDGIWTLSDSPPLNRLVFRTINRMSAVLLSSVVGLDLSYWTELSDKDLGSVFACLPKKMIPECPRDKQGSGSVKEELPALATQQIMHTSEMQYTTAGGEPSESALVQLVSLNISGCWKVTDRSIKELLYVSGLRMLNLSHCPQIKDAGMIEVSQLETLEALNVSWCTGTTDGGFRALARLPNLRVLSASGNPGLLDTVLKQWSGALPCLQSLRLMHCEKLTDAGLRAFFSKERGLTSLDLSECQCLTNATVAQLASNLPSLKWLDLSCCEKITARSLTSLSKLTGLQALNLYGNRHITLASVAHLPASCIATL